MSDTVCWPLAEVLALHRLQWLKYILHMSPRRLPVGTVFSCALRDWSGRDLLLRYEEVSFSYGIAWRFSLSQFGSHWEIQLRIEVCGRCYVTPISIPMSRENNTKKNNRIFSLRDENLKVYSLTLSCIICFLSFLKKTLVSWEPIHEVMEWLRYTVFIFRRR